MTVTLLQPGAYGLLLGGLVVLRAPVDRVRRIVGTALRHTDRKRWRDPDDPGYQTAERNRLIAGMISSGSSVLDLGAGIQQLRRFLPPSCEYQACDLDGGPEVLRCDFNAGVYPAVSHRYDVVVSSGCFEFVVDPQAFLARLPELGDILILSYRVRPTGEPRRRRLKSGYMSHLTVEDLERMLDRLGLQWQRAGVYEHTATEPFHLQPIYRVELRPPSDRRRVPGASSLTEPARATTR